MFGSLGMMELGIIFVILALLFGPSQIPKLGRSLGESIREFRKVGRELHSIDRDVKDEVASIKRDIEQ